MIPKVIGALTVVSMVGGFAWYAGTPPYANKQWAETRLAGVDLRYYQQREDLLDRRIFDMQSEKRKMGRNWPQFMEQELRRLLKERERNKRSIDRLLK